MGLRNEQSHFVYYLAKLVIYAYEELGILLTPGEQDPRKHSLFCQHPKKLAEDLNWWKPCGKCPACLDSSVETMCEKPEWLTKTEDHKKLGEKWESLHPNCRWGGRWQDGNHYEWYPGWRK
jgi:hypothetical protein